MIKDAIANIPKRPRLKLFRRCRLRPKFQVDHSPHLETSVCFRCTVPWFAQRRGQGETESVPVRLHNHDTGGRKCGEDHGVPDRLYRPVRRTASPHTRLRWLSRQRPVAFHSSKAVSYLTVIHPPSTTFTTWSSARLHASPA